MNGLADICHKAPALQSYTWQSHRSTYMHRVAFSDFLRFLMYSRTKKNNPLQQRRRIPCKHFLFNYGCLCLNCLVRFLWHHLLLCLTHSNFRSLGPEYCFIYHRSGCVLLSTYSLVFISFCCVWSMNTVLEWIRSNLMLQMDCITVIYIVHECL